jgi:hypothetical protein
MDILAEHLLLAFELPFCYPIYIGQDCGAPPFSPFNYNFGLAHSDLFFSPYAGRKVLCP